MWRESNPRGASVFKTLPLYRDTPCDSFPRLDGSRPVGKLLAVGVATIPTVPRAFPGHGINPIAGAAVPATTNLSVGRPAGAPIVRCHEFSPPLMALGNVAVSGHRFPPDTTLRMQSDRCLSAPTTTTLR